MKIDIKLDGIAELQKLLNELPREAIIEFFEKEVGRKPTTEELNRLESGETIETSIEPKVPF